MATAGVRLATVSDAKEIARIQSEVWGTAYADILGEEVLAALNTGNTQEQWLAAIEYPETEVYVAFEGDFTVGFAVAGLAPEQESANAAGEAPKDANHLGLIGSLLVEPRWGRRGHGGRLLVAVAEGLKNQSALRGIAWLTESDSASLAFFRRAGWHPDGTIRILDTGQRSIRELRLTGGLEVKLNGENDPQTPPTEVPNT